MSFEKSIRRKKVYITGGSSGIGLALAEYFARKGADVALIARNPSRLSDAKAQCESLCCETGQQINTYSVDVSNKQDLQQKMQLALAEFGAPDMLITSAGQVMSSRFEDAESSDFDTLMNVNLNGTRDTIKALLPAMTAQKSGHIVVIASIAGLVPAYGYSAYNASKYALVGLSGALRQELREKGIQVSLVCPPEVDTPMVAEEAETILPQTRLLKDLCGTLSTEQVVKAIARGIRRNKRMIIPGFRARLTYRLFCWFPDTFSACSEWLINRR